MFEIDLFAFSTVSKHRRTGNWNPSQLTRFVLSCMIKTWVLTAWLELEPGHHQQWYTPGYPGIFHFSAPEGLNKWSLMELRHYLNLCRLIVNWTLGRNFDCWHRRNIFFSAISREYSTSVWMSYISQCPIRIISDWCIEYWLQIFCLRKLLISQVVLAYVILSSWS